MNKVKKIGALAMLLITVNASAQDGSSKITGLYKTESDFVLNKPSNQIDCNSKEGSINADNFFTASSKILIKENGKKYTVPKSEFFGYLDCNNKAYKFYGDQAYQILDTQGFYMYKRTFLAPGKGHVQTTAYYFSKPGSNELVALTKQNMEAAFASDTQFRYALESEFNSDKDLVSYDSYLKNFKVKYLYLETAKK
jgi:hypothetical protein